MRLTPHWSWVKLTQYCKCNTGPHWVSFWPTGFFIQLFPKCCALCRHCNCSVPMLLSNAYVNNKICFEWSSQCESAKKKSFCKFNVNVNVCCIMNSSDIPECRFELVQHSRYLPDLPTLEWDLSQDEKGARWSPFKYDFYLLHTRDLHAP